MLALKLGSALELLSHLDSLRGLFPPLSHLSKQSSCGISGPATPLDPLSTSNQSTCNLYFMYHRLVRLGKLA